VSNYGVHHIRELLATKPRYVPSVNQVELHPFLQRKDIDDYCKKHGIYLEGEKPHLFVLPLAFLRFEELMIAYSPLTRGQRLNDPALVPIAKAHGKTVAQILIRYTLQKVGPAPQRAKAADDRDGSHSPSRSQRNGLLAMRRSLIGNSPTTT
jgi:diketogulonate reductase-like aldo/keto reductase